MTLKNKVQVSIDGKLFPLMGTESEEYIVGVARYVDEKISSIRESDKKSFLTSYLAVILACINITDELFKEREKLRGMEIFEKSGKGPEIITEMEKETEELKAENERLKAELRSVEDMLIEEVKGGKSDFDKEKQNLSEKLDVLQSAFMGKVLDSDELNDIKITLRKILQAAEKNNESLKRLITDEKLKSAGVDRKRRGYPYGKGKL